MTTVPVKSVTVLINAFGTDSVILDLDLPPAIPIYPQRPSAKIEAAAGFGVDWVRANIGDHMTIIDMKTGERAEV